MILFLTLKSKISPILYDIRAIHRGLLKLDNRDLRGDLTEVMNLETLAVAGMRLYTAPVWLHSEVGDYLYRSMPLEEARAWLNHGFFEDQTGSTSWSTDWIYSRSYLTGDKREAKKNFRVQLEVPAHDVLNRMKGVGALPKPESNAETWGTGKTEIGRSGDNAKNAGLLAMYADRKGDLLDPSLRNLSKKKVLSTKNIKNVQNDLFRTMFKDKVPLARVVARLVE